MALTYVLNHASLNTSLVSWWGLNEVSSGGGAVTRYDALGANDLADTGTCASATGKVGRGADFEVTGAPNEYLAKATPTSMTSTTAYSFSCWIKPESVSITQFFIGHSESGDSNIQFQAWVTSGNEITFRRTHSTSSIVDVTSSGLGVTAGVWYHVVGTFSTTNGMVLYVDDTSEATSGTLTATSAPSTSPYFILGQRWRNSQPNLQYDGVIDEVGYWNKELTTAEVTDLYNSGDGMSYGIQYGGISGIGTTSSETSVSVVGTDTIGIVYVVGETAGDNITAITWDGNSMTKIGVTLTPGDRYSSAWFIVAPTAGASTIAYTGGSFFRNISAFYTGAKQSGQEDAVDTNTATTTTSVTTTPVVVADNCWFIMCTKMGNGDAVSFDLGEVRHTSDAGGVGYSDSDGTVGTGSVTGTVSKTGTNTWGAVGFSIAPVAGAAASENALAMCNF